ncbi:lysylphosphatidylglycerol synthase domain-containing protein [Luteimicrobium subarcticum]|uniref:Lysylphosphatidylglycerol synthase-like protein n=1 Tax=Luteimicrobium subarcticum TaxID=620910 RepID=A0A2M8WT73_9MICO|nr:lysylphosphatidylglycerol synthase domain-containing protein [Luteimicrobium subarcticum]PJI94130.1 hypothetical protein CLV34_1616 [Luteimicrobium subarcticum]
MNRLLAAARSRVTRWVFLGVAVALAVWAVVASWDEITAALADLSWLLVGGALVVSIAYVLATMVSWLRLLNDLGEPLRPSSALALFGVSQLGKYIPGGVWNVVAAAELGAQHKISRRRSVAAMAVAVLVSVVSGLLVGALALWLGPPDTRDRWGWAGLLVPVLVVVLVPPVLNRLVDRAFRLMRREPLDQPLSTRGLGTATLWALVGWLLVGLQVWMLAVGVGMEASWRTFALCVGAYGLAWVVGLLVVFVPAGAGAREAVLLVALSGVLPHGAVLAVVLVSRVLVTVTDLLLAGAGLTIARRQARDAAPAGEVPAA